ncbi:MAG: hypothetical protein VKK32_07190 [Candidatus Melainabacteria bacterium]|nr:hypothetical protein [Candidatus Melainabacteria bacterium]
MVSTSIGTNKSFLEQGINPNTVTNPEPTGSIFNAAKAFNQGLKQAEPSARNNIVNFARKGQTNNSRKTNTQHQEKEHSRGFVYSVWESVLKSWTNALLTSSSAEAVVNAIIKEGDATKLSNNLDQHCKELKNLLETGSLSETEKEATLQQIKKLEAAKTNPNAIEYNALNNNIEKTFSDSFLSRLVTDIGVDQSIAAFRRAFPEFAKKNPIVNTLIGDMVARPLTFILRTITAENNILTNSSNHGGEASPEQQIIIEAMKDTGVAKLIGWIRGEDEKGEKKFKLLDKGNGELVKEEAGFNLKKILDPFVNNVNKYLLGITPGETLKDAQGQTLYTTNSCGEKEELKSLAKFNPLHFGITSIASLGLTALTLDKKAQATGFQDANTPLKAFGSMILSNANRIDSAMTSYAHASVRKGESFMGTFHNIIPKKLLMPMCQNFMKGLSNLLPGEVLNPATKSILLNMLVEFIAPPFVQSFMPKAEKRAIDKDTQFVSHSLIKPPLSELINVLKKGWMWWGKNFHAAVGTYPAVIKLTPVSSPFWLIQQITSKLTGRAPKDIPGLFKEKEEEVFAKELPDHLASYKDTGIGKTAFLTLKSILKTPLNVTDWLVKSREANKIYSNLTSNIVKAANLKDTLREKIQTSAANDIVSTENLGNTPQEKQLAQAFS